MNFSAQPLKQQLHSDPLMLAHKGAAARKTERTDCVGNSAQRDLEPVEARLVELMRQGWVSVQDSIRLAGCSSLAQRVSEMKREHDLPIVDEWRQVGRSRFKVYRMAEAV